jgi:uncharacterized protein YraI
MLKRRISRRNFVAAAATAWGIPVIGQWVAPEMAAAQEVAVDFGRYFAETGHNLDDPFLSRWSAAGGVQGVGFPISEERFDADIGIVQDFEGMTLLYDPAESFPWTTQTRPLPQSVIEKSAPASAREGVPGCPDGAVFCQYFPETQHTLSGAFVSYWSLHGDLPIFGMPVSEPFVDDDSKHTIQVFQRAVLEDRGEDGIWARPVVLEIAEQEGLLETPPYRPAPPSAGTTKLVSASQGLRLRSGPGTDAEVIAVLLDSAEFISVPGEDGAWIPGYADGYSGWVSSEFLKEPPPLPQISVEEWNPSIWQGATLSETNVRSQPTTASEIVETLPAGSPIVVTEWVQGEAAFPGADQWSRLDKGGYIYSRNVGRTAPVMAPPLPDDAPTEGRWIDVHLTQQLLTAYEGRDPVRVVVTTTGMAGWETPVGTHWITVRVPNETMRGGSLGAEDFFQLDNVLFTQYFTEKGHAIHFAWWRTPETIGRPGSHGCLNCLLDDSRFLWEWAEYGTRVVVRDK